MKLFKMKLISFGILNHILTSLSVVTKAFVIGTYFNSTFHLKNLGILKVFGIVELMYKINILQKYLSYPTPFIKIFTEFSIFYGICLPRIGTSVSSCQNQLSCTPSANPNSCDDDKTRI